MGIAFMNDGVPETLPCISHETRSKWLLQRVAILRRNPNFGAAATDYANGAVRIFEGRYMANKVMANVARQVICMSILALHFTRSNGNHGATISGIQNITSGLKLCSKNTTAATIDLLENIGLVTRVLDESDHRNHLIQPTNKMIFGIRRITGIALSAADKLFPSRHYKQLIEGSDDFVERYFASSLHSLLNISTMISKLHSSKLFAISDGGGILLCKLMSMKGQPSTVTENTVCFPYDDIGHLYGVSRTHIRRLMKRAEAEGLVRLLEDGGRRIDILPPLDDVFENMVAAHIARAQFDIHLANKDYDLLPIDRTPDYYAV
ncbi:helix-turn-helix domain-containing protein [Phyllobacterium sp. OV277]|uniref:helix-turn-helix domain-containing protein n=1 Tax=Phyllobacterium sp. OV277 TaxID=1882772 RepID=UPI00088CAE66|nr:helix-turn-helix domain-containing protein [Phyllobacterium sp. OV277]SDP52397.1 hypothetical protein SAMN05443582_105281 [Phyllobacterium sp. OV277]